MRIRAGVPDGRGTLEEGGAVLVVYEYFEWGGWVDEERKGTWRKREPASAKAPIKCECSGDSRE